MPDSKADKALKTMHNSIVRVMEMISADTKASTNPKRIDSITDFVLWFERKYKYNFKESRSTLVVKKGDIYYCDFGSNIGSEQNERRPAIILQNNMGNRHSPTTIIAPITDEVKATLPTHVNLDKLKADCSVQGIILIEQMRCISKNRLSNRVDQIDTTSSEWNKVIDAICIELDANIIKNDVDTKET